MGNREGSPTDYIPLTRAIRRSIREMRTNANFKTQDLAFECGYSQPTISRIEAGKIKQIRKQLLECIAEKTGGNRRLLGLNNDNIPENYSLK